jgi:hypothetical protein
MKFNSEDQIPDGFEMSRVSRKLDELGFVWLMDKDGSRIGLNLSLVERILIQEGGSLKIWTVGREYDFDSTSARGFLEMMQLRERGK